MNLWRGLTRRMVVVGAISIVLLTAGIGVAMVLVVTKYFVVRAAELVPLPSDDALAACRAAPERWHHHYPASTMDAFAYDAQTLRSSNPDAPAIPKTLVDQLAAGVARPIDNSPARAYGAHIVLRVADDGPCGLVMIRWPRTVEGTVSVIATLGLIALGGVAVTLALFIVFVLRPMVNRLRRLEAAASGVGDPSAYAPIGDAASDEIGSVARVLDRAHGRIREDAGRLDAARRRLEQHLADVAHDLRTPLASLGLTLEELAPRLADDGRALAGRALGDVVYLAALVENLHMATRLADGGALSRGQAELGEIVERVCLRFALLGRERGVTVDVARPEAPLVVACEPAAAERAIANLVHNAVAHGEPGGHVALVLDRVDGGRFRLLVLDDGPGVPPAELPRLSDPTAMSDPARRRAAKGSGLGLVITSEVCRRCAWTLTFAAAEPRGLQVVVEGTTVASPSSSN